MAKNLALCYDGTWNKMSGETGADANTNVVKIYRSIRETPTQFRQYDAGVGSRWYDHVLGGAIGFGVDFNIMQGYAWLSDHYEEGDQIYLFGFSRGAFTARSLAGFIHRIGLLPQGNGLQVFAAYERYKHGPLLGRVADWARGATPRPVRIAFIGVWDTVGALGLPEKYFSGLNHMYYGFHDIDLHDNVDHAYHALAVDEHRLTFNASLWDPPADSPTVLEQRWFVGAHADIGGGYPDHQQWANYTLRWMQRRAQECGLDVDVIEAPTLDELAAVHDSYADFLKGHYARQVPAYHRPMGQTANGGEVIDPIVRNVMAMNPNYRPANPGIPSIEDA